VSKYKLEDSSSNRTASHYPDYHHRKDVILNCGTGTGVVLPSHREDESQLNNPYTCATVALDTSNLYSPTVKVDYSSIITYKETGYYLSDLRLTFQLSKVCDDGCKISLGTWNYERYFDFDGGKPRDQSRGRCPEVETVDSFCFTYCKCDDCPGCCTYIVELINCETRGVDCTVVSNAMITAMAVGYQSYDG